MLTEPAPAKINLALHVTAQRDDGYHILDSLVAFADIGDRIIVEPADALSLKIVGPFGAGLSTGDDNLVLKAARLFGSDRGAKITLEKNLPVASGIGGGSADAAACLRGLSRLWGLPLPHDAVSLGADVPVCLHGAACRMQGIGDEITPVKLSGIPAVLINPGVGVSTPEIFSALASKTNPALPDFSDISTPETLFAYLEQTRNDLGLAAEALCPPIAGVLSELASFGSRITRMSGSGATCFGLFESGAMAQRVAKHIASKAPDWWVQATVIGSPAVT